MRKHIIVANWKTQPTTPHHARDLFMFVKGLVTRLRAVEVIIAPPALYIPILTSGYSGNKVRIAGQCMSLYESGPHTGEIPAEMLAGAGARYVLVEHSERGTLPADRALHLRVKTFIALKYNLVPVVFIGERVRDGAGTYLNVIREEIIATLHEIPEGRREEVVFCYEPVWAIGKDEAMDIYDIHQMALFIRKVLLEVYGARVSKTTKVLYGGSVDEENISAILAVGDLDGVVVGRVSVDTERFGALLKIANKSL